MKEQQWRTIRSNPICGELPVPEEYRGNGGQVVLRFRFRIPEDGEYTLMFNSPTSNQVYLDPAGKELHDDLHMLFGRQRLFPAMERPDGSFPCGEHPVIFSPALGGAPMNQYRRHLRLTQGMHTLVAALEPQSFESKIRWGTGIGIGSRFLEKSFK